MNRQRCVYEWRPSQKPTFIVEGAVKVVAAGVETCGELYEVASPGVACSRETGEGHQLLSSSGEEVPVHAAVV